MKKKDWSVSSSNATDPKSGRRSKLPKECTKDNSKKMTTTSSPPIASVTGGRDETDDRVNLLNNLTSTSNDNCACDSSSSRNQKEQSAKVSNFLPRPKLPNVAALLTLLKVSLMFTIGLSLLWFHVRLSKVETDLASCWTPLNLNQQQNQNELFNGRRSRFDVSQESTFPASSASSSYFTKRPDESKTTTIKGKMTTKTSNEIEADDEFSEVNNEEDSVQNGTNHRVKRRAERHEGGSGRRSRLNKRSKGQSHVEIINPRLREEMEGSRLREDSDGVSQPSGVGGEYTGEGGSDPDWVWLTSYSRIPVQAFEEFCAGTQKYCPPAPPGPEGRHGKAGPKGEKGDQGFAGERGPMGLQGLSGYPGVRGAAGPTGPPGQPGSDGRDGLPGEPGLDGIPGRNGLDGIPGLPGTTGLPGSAGRNGTDGIPGQNGQQGPPGPAGSTGLPGQKGWQGPKGEPGKHGLPGTVACELNCSSVSRGPTQGLVIPPSIMGSEIEPLMRPLIVKEGDNVRLRCSATGFPRPSISWRREDSRLTPGGQWSVSDISGPVLNLTSVNRAQMGKYFCLANNGINPPASRVFDIKVHFPPYIRVYHPDVQISVGSNATLECFVEAYPNGVTYWETADMKLLSFRSDKYRMAANITDIYQIRMTLTIMRTTHSDLKTYVCVCKNEFKTVKGRVRLSEVDNTRPTPSTNDGEPDGPTQTYGKESPPLVDMPDECPPPQTTVCTTCPPRIEQKCNTGVYHLLDYTHFEIGFLGNIPRPKINETTYEKRNSSMECLLSAVGKPVYHGVSNFNGSWMRETFSNNTQVTDKYWVTNMNKKYELYEYHNKSMFTLVGAGGVTKTYHLPKPFQGNSHVVYNGSFFYVKEPERESGSFVDEKPTIVRYGLMSPWKERKLQEIELPFASFQAQRLYRYSNKRNWTWVDLAVDENGLWAIHSLENSDNLAVVKLDLNEYGNYTITYGWNVEIYHKYAGDMFIICGIIYAVDDVDTVETRIRLALDLYQEKLLKIDLPFTNPFSDTVMVSYNPKTKELFTWDKGNQLIYPIKQIPVHPPVPEEKRKSIEEILISESK